MTSQGQNGQHQKINNSKCWRGYEGKRTLLPVGGNESQLIHKGEPDQGSLKTKQKYHRTSNPTPGHRFRENHYFKRQVHEMFKEALCTTAKTWKQPKWIRTDKWINKTGYMHTVHYYSAIKGRHHAMSSNKEEVETIILSDGRQRKTSIM